MPRLVIRTQLLNGSWQPLTTSYRAGVYVEGFQCSADMWGPADATFTLRRSPRVAWPDLGFWTPVEVEIEGQLVWSGRVIATPGSDGASDQISVTCQGWQYHLDDRPYTKWYVKNALSDWQDYRSAVAADLSLTAASVQVTTDAGALTLTLPNGATLPNGRVAGVFIDLGPFYPTGGQIQLDFDTSNNQTAITAILSFATNVGGLPTAGAALNISNLAVAGTGSNGLTWAGAFRYIAILLTPNGGVAITPGADDWWRARNIRLYSSSAYQSGGASILTATTLVRDALTHTQALSTSTALIGTTSFQIQAFAADAQTPRDVIVAANAFQDWQARVTADRVLEYRAKPTTALLALTDQAAFDDTSSGSGESIFNEVTYVGTDPTGAQLVVTRTTTAAGLAATIPDRQGVTKGYTIQSGAALTSAAAQQICDVFLSQRNTTPFRGTIHATSGRSLTIHPSGASVQPYQLLRYPGELATFKHLQNPDTGSLGRDGRVARVTYTFDTDSAEVDIDSTAGSFEALQARLAVVTNPHG